MKFHEEDKFSAVIGGILLAAVLLTALFSLIGCSSTQLCPECIPDIRYERVDVPVRFCEPPASLTPIQLPPWPSLPADPSVEDVKSWYAQCAAVLEAREEILRNRIKLIEDMLDSYR